jgi:hypothetical protein
MEEHVASNDAWGDDSSEESADIVLDAFDTAELDKDEIDLYTDIDTLGMSLHANSKKGNGYRCLCPDDNVLSRYISEHTSGNSTSTGFLGHGPCITPLHVIPLVPVSTSIRVGVHASGTTKLGTTLAVSYHLAIPKFSGGVSGGYMLSELLDYINESMVQCDITPRGFQTNTRAVVGDYPDLTPLTLGYGATSDLLRDVNIQRVVDGQAYIVPSTCPDKRYKVPCWLGSSMLMNSIVLMYPNVAQYLLSGEHRQPHREQLGFLLAR